MKWPRIPISDKLEAGTGLRPSFDHEAVFNPCFVHRLHVTKIWQDPILPDFKKCRFMHFGVVWPKLVLNQVPNFYGRGQNYDYMCQKNKLWSLNIQYLFMLWIMDFLVI